MDIVYKVLLKSNEGLSSSNLSPTEENLINGLVLVYKINEWTRPKIKNSKLFCFINEDFAKKCYKALSENDEDRFILYKCEALNIEKPKLCPNISSIIDNIEEYWNNYAIFEGIDDKPPIFEGTMFADELKLIEEIIP